MDPYGLWKVESDYVDASWISDQDPKVDFAFLVVEPNLIDGRLRNIESVTGGLRLGGPATAKERVTVTGYAAGVGGKAVTCTVSVYRDGAYPAFNCDPYKDGTSGAPWMHKSGSTWVVIGVIGGLDQGGCFPWTSYSAPFTEAVRTTYAQAVTGGEQPEIPLPGGDGCKTGS
jgi:V8-like Glu-specific endopeptidase